MFAFVSGVVVVTVTTFTFVPVAFTVALTVIVAEAPAASVPIEQSSASAVVVHVPAVVVAETKLTLAGAESATLMFAAGSGPAFETTIEYVIGAVPPPSGSFTAGVAVFVTVMSAFGDGGGVVGV